MANNEIVDVEGGDAPQADGLVTGLVVFTFLALLAGFIIIEKALADNYNVGMLAK